VIGEAVIAWVAERVHNAAIVIIAIVAGAAVCAMLVKLEKSQVTKPPRDVEVVVTELSDRMLEAERKIARLGKLVLMPRFTRHQSKCEHCREGAVSEEGGPAPLCAEGFGLLIEDAQEQSPEEL
jgi:hypothetical protein